MSHYNVHLKSVYLNDINEVSVIMPDAPMRTSENPEEYYMKHKKFKVLWLFHGGRDTMRDITLYSNIARLAVKYGIMIVIPNGHDSDFMNHPEMGDGYMFHDFFVKELVPFIHNWFPASDQAEDNWLSGFSMGCAATWQYGIMHPELFGHIAPLCNQPLDYRYLEPYSEMTSYQFKKRLQEDKHAFPAAYGSLGESIHTKEINTICKYDTVGEFLASVENTMVRFEEAAFAKKLPKIWVPCGNEPRDFKLKKFSEKCAELGVANAKFEFFTEDTHCFAFWERAVEMFLVYLGLEEVNYFYGV